MNTVIALVFKLYIMCKRLVFVNDRSCIYHRVSHIWFCIYVEVCACKRNVGI